MAYLGHRAVSQRSQSHQLDHFMKSPGPGPPARDDLCQSQEISPEKKNMMVDIRHDS
jgi:hypothetical protein